MDQKVLLAISRNQARIWSHGLEVNTPPVVVNHWVTHHGFGKVIHRLFGRLTQNQLSPIFAERIIALVVGAEELFLVGVLNDETTTLSNFVIYLGAHHPALAEQVQRVSEIDFSNIPDEQIMAEGRRLMRLR